MKKEDQNTVVNVIASVFGGILVLWLAYYFLSFLFEHWKFVLGAILLILVVGLYFIFREDSG
jgi:hypothetical protein